MFGKKKEKKIINIEGMHCENCAKKVERALCNIDNVEKAKVNLNKKQAIITLKDKVNNDTIATAITDLDFEVTNIE